MASKWEKLCSIMHKARRIFKAVAFVIIVVMYSASAKTITVDNNQSADFTRIQDAIDFAESGDTIFVYSGNFYETITIDKKRECIQALPFLLFHDQFPEIFIMTLRCRGPSNSQK